MQKLATVYLVRHAESVANAVYADPDHKPMDFGPLGSDLTKKGIAQACNLAASLKKIHFDVAFSSDFVRAHRTAKIIVEERALEVITKEIIRERSYGSLEGKLTDEIAGKIAELQKGLSDIEKMRVKYVHDMETEENASGRLLTFLREIGVAYTGKTILVVAHGNIMRTSLVRMGLGTYSELPAGSIDNAGYAIIETDGTDFFIEKTEGITKTEVK